MQLLANGKQQFIDQNGAPLAGGLVYIYAPGTANPVDTYKDQAGLSKNTKPIQLDSRGQAVIWGTGTFRQVVADAAGTMLWDQLVSMPDINAPTNALSTALAASSGANQVGFLQAGVGPVLRTVQDKLRDIVSIEDFGAKPDGSDSSGAVQAALNTGKLVRIPPNDYTMMAGFSVPQGGGIYGEGEKSRLLRNFHGPFLTHNSTSRDVGSPVTIRDFCLDIAPAYVVAAGDTGIDIGATSSWVGRGCISGLLIIHQWDGFKWRGGTMNNMTNIQVIEGKGHGFYGVDARGELNGCLAQYCAGNGYFFFSQTQGETGVQLTSCGTFGNQGWGYLFDAAPGIIGANIYLKGVSSSTDGTGGIGFAKEYRQIWMTQILIESAGDAYVPYPSFVVHNEAPGLYLVSNCKQIVGSDIFIQTCRGPGAYFDATTGLSLANLTVQSCGRGGLGGANSAGIVLNSGNIDAALVNVVANFGSAQTYDIYFAQVTNACSITNASFRAYFSPPLNVGVRLVNMRTTANAGVPASAILALPDYSDLITITAGEALINAINASYAGRRVTLVFTVAVMVADGNNLRLNTPLSAAADTTLSLVCDGTTWFETGRSIN